MSLGKDLSPYIKMHHVTSMCLLGPSALFIGEGDLVGFMHLTARQTPPLLQLKRFELTVDCIGQSLVSCNGT